LTEEDLEFLRSDGAVAVAAAPKRTARTRAPQASQAATGGENVDDFPSSAAPEPHESATPTTSGPVGGSQQPQRVRKQRDIPPSTATLTSTVPTLPVSAGQLQELRPGVHTSVKGRENRKCPPPASAWNETSTTGGLWEPSSWTDWKRVFHGGRGGEHKRQERPKPRDHIRRRAGCGLSHPDPRSD